MIKLSKNDNFIEELDDSNIFVYSSSYLEENNEQFIDTLLNQTNKHIVWVNTKINDNLVISEASDCIIYFLDYLIIP